jgi:hypothetical protein
MSKADEIFSNLTAQATQPLTNKIEISYFKVLISIAKEQVKILMRAVATEDNSYNDKYIHIQKVFTNIEAIENSSK